MKKSVHLLLFIVIISSSTTSAAQTLDARIVTITSISPQTMSGTASKFRIETQIEVTNPSDNEYTYVHTVWCVFILIIEYEEHDDWVSNDSVPCDLARARDTIYPGTNNFTGHGFITFDADDLDKLPDGAYTISFADILFAPNLETDQPQEFDYEIITHDYHFSIEDGEIILPRFVLNTPVFGLVAPLLIGFVYRRRKYS